MNVGGGQIRGTLLNFFVVKKCAFFSIFRMLPSVSEIIPANVWLWSLFCLWNNASYRLFQFEQMIWRKKSWKLKIET